MADVGGGSYRHLLVSYEALSPWGEGKGEGNEPHDREAVLTRGGPLVLARSIRLLVSSQPENGPGGYEVVGVRRGGGADTVRTPHPGPHPPPDPVSSESRALSRSNSTSGSGTESSTYTYPICERGAAGMMSIRKSFRPAAA